MTKRCLLILISLAISTNLFAAPSVSGRKAVAAAGTAERLTSTSAWCNILTVTAFEANTDIVAVGASTVDATESTRNGLVLFAGQTEYISGRTDIKDVWVDSEVNGEGVTYNCLN